MITGIDPKFVDLVAQMRKAQNDYYASKLQSDLRKACELEMQVDKWLEDIRVDQARLQKWARTQ